MVSEKVLRPTSRQRATAAPTPRVWGFTNTNHETRPFLEPPQAPPTSFSRITNHETRITAFFRNTAFSSYCCPPARPDYLSSRLLQDLGDPGVEAFALCLGGYRGRPVNLWWNPKGNLPGKGFIRSSASFFAGLQIVVHREFKLLPELSGGSALENNHVPSIHHLSMEDAGRVIESNGRSVPFVFHHRSIPASFRNRLAESTTPFRASFPGWGRWK